MTRCVRLFSDGQWQSGPGVVADKLVAEGAIPLTLSDTSGFIYERGVTIREISANLHHQSRRDARIGRYIVASTTAKYNDPEDIFDVPCDLVFPTNSNEIDAQAAEKLANDVHYDRGCGLLSDDPEAIASLKKLGVAHCPFRATLAIGNALAYTSRSTRSSRPTPVMKLIKEAARVFLRSARAGVGVQRRGIWTRAPLMRLFLRGGRTAKCNYWALAGCHAALQAMALSCYGVLPRSMIGRRSGRWK